MTWSPWHNPKAVADVRNPRKSTGKFISPVLFVDGHTKVHDFTHSLFDNPTFPYEPTKDWVWYKRWEP